MRWFFFIYFFNVYLFLRQGETEREQGRVRERETQNPKQAPGSELSAQSPTRGWNSRTVRSWPERKSAAQPTEPLRGPYIYSFLRDRDRTWAGEGQREGETIWSRLQVLSCQQRALHMAWTHKPWDQDLSWSWSLNWLSHPGTPVRLLLISSRIVQTGVLLGIWLFYLDNFSRMCFSIRPSHK